MVVCRVSFCLAHCSQLLGNKKLAQNLSIKNTNTQKTAKRMLITIIVWVFLSIRSVVVLLPLPSTYVLQAMIWYTFFCLLLFFFLPFHDLRLYTSYEALLHNGKYRKTVLCLSWLSDSKRIVIVYFCCPSFYFYVVLYCCVLFVEVNHQIVWVIGIRWLKRLKYGLFWLRWNGSEFFMWIEWELKVLLTFDRSDSCLKVFLVLFCLNLLLVLKTVHSYAENHFR